MAGDEVEPPARAGGDDELDGLGGKLRQRRQGLTLARNLMCTEGELLMVAGGVERVVTAWMSIG